MRFVFVPCDRGDTLTPGPAHPVAAARYAAVARCAAATRSVAAARSVCCCMLGCVVCALHALNAELSTIVFDLRKLSQMVLKTAVDVPNIFGAGTPRQPYVGMDALLVFLTISLVREFTI